MRTLLIDDIRDIHCDVTARNVEVAKAVLLSGLSFDVVYLDHDLGCRETGLDILRWMFAVDVRPKHVVLVTMNPVGRRNMESELTANDYKRVGGVGGTTWQDCL